MKGVAGFGGGLGKGFSGVMDAVGVGRLFGSARFLSDFVLSLLLFCFSIPSLFFLFCLLYCSSPAFYFSPLSCLLARLLDSSF